MKKCLCIVVNHDEKFLLVKHTAGSWKNKWFFPGMQCDDESELKIEEMLLRLLYFQTGYILDIRKLLFSEYYNDVKAGRRALYIYISAGIIGGRMKKSSTRHSTETKWVKRSGMSELDMVLNIPEAVTRYKTIFQWLDQYQPEMRLM